MREKSKLAGGIYKMPAELRFCDLLRPFLLILAMTVLHSGCTKEQYGTDSDVDPLKAAGINEVIPADLADGVKVNPVVKVTFKPGTDPSKISTSDLTLKKGSSPVPGRITISGTTSIFTPETVLLPETEYTATIVTGRTNSSKDAEPHEYSWKFKTGKHQQNNSPAVIATDPAGNATSVPVAPLIKVTFNQELTTTMQSSLRISLKKGTLSVEGILSFSGNTATFKPDVNLTPGTMYSCRVKIEDIDIVDDDKPGDSYLWSFTTEEEGSNAATPAVITVVPANNALFVILESTSSITFNAPMNPATINTTTITLSQGTIPVTGSVAYSGVTATFKPSAALVPGTVYTGMVTTGVQDIAGNALAANYTWSFKTADSPLLLSFATDVVPVLSLCNDCHKHPWNASSTASAFYTDLVNGGYVKPSSPTRGKIYTRLSGGHPATGLSTADRNKVLDWIIEGSKNN